MAKRNSSGARSLSSISDTEIVAALRKYKNISLAASHLGTWNANIHKWFKVRKITFKEIVGSDQLCIRCGIPLVGIGPHIHHDVSPDDRSHVLADVKSGIPGWMLVKKYLISNSTINRWRREERKHASVAVHTSWKGVSATTISAPIAQSGNVTAEALLAAFEKRAIEFSYVDPLVQERLQAENERLRAENKQLALEREQFRAKRDEIAKERDTLLKQITSSSLSNSLSVTNLMDKLK